MKDREKKQTGPTGDPSAAPSQDSDSQCPSTSADPTPHSYHTSAFQASPFPTTLIDAKGIIVDVNQAHLDFAARFGLRIQKQDRIGHPVSVFAGPPEKQRRFQEFVESLFAGGKDSQLHWKTTDNPEGLVSVIIHGRLLRDPDGQISGALLTREDVSPREREVHRRQIIHRIREQVWTMRSSADVEQLLRTLRNALLDLGLHFRDCAVNFVDVDSGKSLVQFNNLGDDEHWTLTEAEGEGSKNIVEIWRSKEVAYRPDLEGDDAYGENPYIHVNLGHRVRSVVDIPFAHGTLAVNSEAANAFSTADLEALREVAQVLEEGFSRIDDLRILEERNRELERQIEARENAERLLRQSHETLERQVDERTADLRVTNEKLQEEIAERLRTEDQLQHSLREKETLLQEIHHRVKNNLQIVSSLIDLQTRNVTDPQFLHMFQDSRDRIRSMAMIHEKLYQSADLAHIDLHAYIDALTRDLFHSHGLSADRVELDLQIDSMTLVIDQAIASGLIINELVSNALKYAFPDGRRGRIRIELRQLEASSVLLAVSDDGIGIPPDLDLKQIRSLGLKLVSSLTSQLRGSIEMSGENGSRFRIVFPAKNLTSG